MMMMDSNPPYGHRDDSTIQDDEFRKIGIMALEIHPKDGFYFVNKSLNNEEKIIKLVIGVSKQKKKELQNVKFSVFLEELGESHGKTSEVILTQRKQLLTKNGVTSLQYEASYLMRPISKLKVTFQLIFKDTFVYQLIAAHEDYNWIMIRDFNETTLDEVSSGAHEERMSVAGAGMRIEKLQKVLDEASEQTGKTLEETQAVNSINAEGRRFDLVVFGATGFTGQYTVDEVSRVAEEERLSWAVAGRSMEKLQKVLSEASERTGKTLEEIPVIIADVSSPQSLAEMAKQTKVVLNCVGPYRFYGEPVVQACIENGTHHLDISGEPQFLEKMQLLYNKKAAENNVFVIGSVGFDSIPAEIGLEYTRQQFKEGELSNVESFIETKVGPEGAVINTGTFESAVYGVAYRNELGSLRKALYPDPMPKLDYRLPKRSFLFFNDDLKKWCLPFLGSDKSVVYRTIRDGLNSQRLKKPIEFIPYTCCSSLFSAMGIILFGLVFFFLSSFSWGRSFLLKYPHIVSLGFFKKGGPTRKQIESTSFSMTFVGYGYTEDVTDRTGQKPNKTIVTKLMGPEPGYVTTPICMVQSAVTLLKESSNMFHKGGVLTPGAAFSGTNLMERLQKHNITLMTISPDNSQDKKAD